MKREGEGRASGECSTVVCRLCSHSEGHMIL